MGNRTSKAERKHREAAKDAAFKQAKEKVRAQQPANFGALIAYQDPAELLRRAKETQLDRRGKPFTKADLVAIFMKVTKTPENSPDLPRYLAMSNDDLRAAIRLKIYAPEIFEDKSEANIDHREIKEEKQPAVQQYRPVIEAPIMEEGMIGEPDQPGMINPPPSHHYSIVPSAPLSTS
jgi:hypothetical protein